MRFDFLLQLQIAAHQFLGTLGHPLFQFGMRQGELLLHIQQLPGTVIEPVGQCSEFPAVSGLNESCVQAAVCGDALQLTGKMVDGFEQGSPRQQGNEQQGKETASNMTSSSREKISSPLCRAAL